MSAQTFWTLIGLSNLTDTDRTSITRWLQGHNDDEITQCLKNPDVRQQLANRLGFPNLFECKDESAIDEMVHGPGYLDASKSAEGHVRWIDLRNPAAGELPEERSRRLKLADSEKDAINILAERLTSQSHGLVSWLASFPLGASFIVSELRVDERVLRFYNQICLVRPMDEHDPFDRPLRYVTTLLGGKTAHERPLIDALKKKRILLVLLSAEAAHRETVSKGSLLDRVLQLASKSHVQTLILSVGQSDRLALTKDADRQFSSQLADALKIKTGERWNFFLRQWRRFGALRNSYRAEEAGSVIKRAHWHYEAVKERDVWPINIRLRAFLATNPDNYVVFDPTAGFEALAGASFVEHDDIRLFVEDVEAFIEHQNEGDYDKRIRALRYVSTGKYWLRHVALEALCEAEADLEIGAMGTGKAVDLLRQLKPAVEIVDQAIGKGIEKRYVAGIGVKAIVQDAWRKTAPVERALAHHRVAVRLFRDRHNRDVLDAEFPFAPHWNDSSIYFVSEVIRHLMRTIEKSTPATFGPRVPPAGVKSRARSQVTSVPDFPEEPQAESNGCHSGEVLGYCFDYLYQRLLNADNALSAKHGAYALAIELLQLMSHKGMIGIPHPALPESSTRSFIKECANALFNIGELEDALACYQRLQGDVSQTPSAGDQLESLEIDCRLCEILTALNHLGEAEAIMRQASAAAERMGRELARQSAGRKDAQQHLVECRRIQKDLFVREAHLTYLLSSDENLLVEKPSAKNSVVELTRSIDANESALDLIHYKIAGLMQSESSSDGEEAFAMCLTVLIRLASQNRHHDALGFRIALGHILRHEGRLTAAEKLLDTAHSDILLHGCSERTYLAFLIEAGRLLSEQGRQVRAYASYLRPAYQRANARLFDREKQTALKHAKMALLVIEQKFHGPRLEEEADWGEHIDRLQQEDAAYNLRDNPTPLGQFARDPLFGYSIAEAGKAIQQLGTLEGVRDALAEVSALADVQQNDTIAAIR